MVTKIQAPFSPAKTCLLDSVAVISCAVDPRRDAIVEHPPEPTPAPQRVNLKVNQSEPEIDTRVAMPEFGDLVPWMFAKLAANGITREDLLK